MTAALEARWRRALPVAMVGLGVLGTVFTIQLLAELAAPPGPDGHHDLLAFWAAGRLILEGRPGDLYDAAALTAIQRTVIPVPIGMNGYMPFINPPVAAVAFAPLSALPEVVARVAWAGLNVVLAAVAGAWISRDLPPRERVLGVFLVATSYPMIHALAEGQWSILLLVAGLAALAAARRGAWATAGMALAAFGLKPQFVVLPLLFLALGRRWRAVGAAMLSGAIVLAVALPATGLAANLAYLGYLVDVVTSHFSGAGTGAAAIWQGDLSTTEGLNGLLVGWFGQGSTGLVNVLWAVSVVVVLSAVGLAMRAARPTLATSTGRTLLEGGIATVLLVNPNQFVQDCVLLFLALDVLGPLPDRQRLPAIVMTVAVADLTALDLRLPWLHLFTVVLVVAVGWAIRLARSGGSRSLPGAMEAAGT
ncbi:MAG: DUF2029 domain-containing protein [Chloroflexi bacterium]|nr:DUF2029 domain-containing protein [Chloroflexota bacterium]